jgi:hypothetical protein
MSASATQRLAQLQQQLGHYQGQQQALLQDVQAVIQQTLQVESGWRRARESSLLLLALRVLVCDGARMLQSPIAAAHDPHTTRRPRRSRPALRAAAAAAASTLKSRRSRC